MTDHDWEEMRAIGAELSALTSGGRFLSPADYERLLARAEAAVGEHRYLLELIVNWNPFPPK